MSRSSLTQVLTEAEKERYRKLGEEDAKRGVTKTDQPDEYYEGQDKVYKKATK